MSKQFPKTRVLCHKGLVRCMCTLVYQIHRNRLFTVYTRIVLSPFVSPDSVIWLLALGKCTQWKHYLSPLINAFNSNLTQVCNFHHDIIQ